MSGGLLALLDDVAAIAKVAAASLDDVAAQTVQAGTKAAGIVIDDTAVTPRYVVGFAADRELPIIAKIAWGSLKNKLLILMPAALALSFFAPWAITPLLMAGGAFLCFEGAEKLIHKLLPHDAHADGPAEAAGDPRALEEAKVAGAIRTDMILSAEIMAITLASVATAPFVNKLAVLAAVGFGVTALVYGLVALIVKADDAGVALVRRGGALAPVGRFLVAAMPPFLGFLSVLGTAAMLWVGGGIVLHGMEEYGLGGLAHAIHDAGNAVAQAVGATLGPALGWLTEAAGAGLFGVALGGVVISVISLVVKPLMRLARA